MLCPTCAYNGNSFPCPRCGYAAPVSIETVIEATPVIEAPAEITHE
jgi:hypothetical protein